MRLVDADALGTEVIKTHLFDKGDVIKLIESAPTIDAVEVVRGEWKPFDQTWGREIWYCTACETSMHMPTRMGKPMYDYCPYCGAKMKGSDDD